MDANTPHTCDTKQIDFVKAFTGRAPDKKKLPTHAPCGSTCRQQLHHR